MPGIAEAAAEHTELEPAQVASLENLVASWDLIADLGFSDLVLWLPTWNGAGYVAAAQVRPATASTAVPEDVVGNFLPRGRHADMDRAVAQRTSNPNRLPSRPAAPQAVEFTPIVIDQRVCAVVARHPSPLSRGGSDLEDIYLTSADQFLSMAGTGDFPAAEEIRLVQESPRVGDGLIKLDPGGRVEYASPNATSALRRLGLATHILGQSFIDVAQRLAHKPFVGTSAAVVSGRVAGRFDLAGQHATVMVRTLPFTGGTGSLVLLRDVTDVRRGQRAVMSRDATIREIHHRVKNNLQTVAALLRLQSRRSASDETRLALAEAHARVAAIAVVHEALSTDTAEQVDLGVVLQALAALMRDLAPAFENPPEIAVECGPISLPGEVATPLAMCVTEALANALEHASASIVAVSANAEGRYVEVRVSDNGVGMPADEATEGLGISIVRALAETELRGDVTWISDQGTTVVIRADIRPRQARLSAEAGA